MMGTFKKHFRDKMVENYKKLMTGQLFTNEEEDKLVNKTRGHSSPLAWLKRKEAGSMAERFSRSKQAHLSTGVMCGPCHQNVF